MNLGSQSIQKSFPRTLSVCGPTTLIRVEASTQQKEGNWCKPRPCQAGRLVTLCLCQVGKCFGTSALVSDLRQFVTVLRRHHLILILK